MPLLCALACVAVPLDLTVASLEDAEAVQRAMQEGMYVRTLLCDIRLEIGIIQDLRALWDSTAPKQR